MLSLVIPQSESEWIGLIAGIIIGLIYAFDGWGAYSGPGQLKDSLRIKNLKFVVGGLFLIFVASFKDWDPKAARISIFREYLIGFILTLVVVLGVITLSIFLKFVYIRRFDKENYPKPPFTPVADYLHWGHKYYRERYAQALLTGKKGQSRIDLEANEDFFSLYLRDLTYAIATVEKAGRDPAARAHIAKTLLRAIVGIVEKHPVAPQGMTANSNYMLARPKDQISEGSKRKIRFSQQGQESRYWGYLEILEYATESPNNDFLVLPVENLTDHSSQQRSLPGAPLAFLLNDTIVVDDVNAVKYSRHFPRALQKELKDYFRNRPFKSFGCINLIRTSTGDSGPNQTRLGILVVESSHLYVFGKTKEEKQRVVAMLHPYLLLLSRLIS
jgi:hypothetical protein